MKKLEIADLSKRRNAVYIDYLVYAGIIFLAGTAAGQLDDSQYALRILIVICCLLIYEPLMVSLFGCTIGHRFNSLRVRKDVPEYRKLNFFEAFLRFLIKLVLGRISFSIVHNNSNRKAIHDKTMNSTVLELKTVQ